MKPITRCFLWKICWKIGGRRSNSIKMEWKYAAASAAYLTHEWKQRDFEYDLPLAPPRVKTLKTTSESEPSHSHPVSKNSENS